MPLPRYRLLALALAAAFCGASSAVRAEVPEGPALTPLTLAFVGVADAVPVVYALQQGWFEKAGLDVKLTTLGSGALSITAIIGGAADIATSNVLSAISARERGIPITLIVPLGRYDAALPTTQVLVLRDAPIRTAKDLEGRTVGVTSLYDIATIGLKAWMSREGTDPTKVHLFEAVQSTMLATLQTKRIDAFVASEPILTAAEATGQTRMLAAPYDAIAKQFITDGLFVSGAWLATHREATTKFTGVLTRATAYANAHYDEMIPVIASFTKLTPNVLRNMRHIKDAPALNAGDLQPVIDAAAKYGAIQNSFPARDMLLPR